MDNSVSSEFEKAGEALFKAVNAPGADISICVNSTLNKHLRWPFRADSVRIIDSDGKSTEFQTAICAISPTQSEHQRTDVKVDAVSCGVHVVENLGPKELRGGYEHIASLKRQKGTEILEIEYPVNIAPLGIIFAIDSNYPVEEIAQLMIPLNKSYPSSEWPDMVTILKQGTINYSAQIHGQPTKGDFFLPNIIGFPVMPMYVQLIARGIGLSSVNKMFAFMFMHLQTFSPGIQLPDTNEVLGDVSRFGISLSTYQFNLNCQLVQVSNDLYLKEGMLPPFPFRVEDPNGKLLCHLRFIPWQDGGVVHLEGNMPLEAILRFFGRQAINAQIIKQSDGAISSVLPIQESHFREMLEKFKRETNMNVRPEEPNWTVLKYADEGTTSPFVARLFLGILRLRDVVFKDNTIREKFDKDYVFVIETLMNARPTSKEIIQTLTQHTRRVSQGEIAQLKGHVINISENIDNKLQKQVAEFLNSTVRVLKDGMQKLSKDLLLDIGFLFNTQGAFEIGIATLSKTNPELSLYLQETRKWSQQLILVRNKLHEGWMLPRMEYLEACGGIKAVQPKISSQPVSQFVVYMLDRVCCFVEDICAYGLQTQMSSGISITQVPISERRAECPERFQVTFVDGGKPIWEIAYHVSKFEET